jgi:hypothetical protein
MRIPLYLAVAQWALLLALGVLVVTAYRQLGRVLGQATQPAELGPPPGTRPGRIAYTRVRTAPPRPPARHDDHGHPAAPDPRPEPDARAAPSAGHPRPDRRRRRGDHGRPSRAAAPDGSAVRVFVPGGGQPALIAFVDPTCPACEQLVTALSQAGQDGRLAGLRVLLLTSDPPAYLQISAAFQATSLELGRPLDRADLEPYRATATPLLVALAADGTVARAGTAASPDDVRAFAAACRRPAPAPGALLPVTTSTA